MVMSVPPKGNTADERGLTGHHHDDALDEIFGLTGRFARKSCDTRSGVWQTVCKRLLAWAHKLSGTFLG
jgi:hypothetical protein